MTKPWWEVKGHDNLSDEECHLFWCSRKEEAFRMGRQKFKEIKATQPGRDTGGPADQHSIQDTVFVISPDGEKFPVLIEESHFN
ncbi:hypothetical protein COU01_03125 [Candidatus Falkowbacteria bacterium CG10_big_fil_rev_8_21_14_0_10_44_15]|uniref:Uncharacterized protein n=1 Tax=Candidatus Falkowbacteria bacterium CG10_big_fil_rev_8_21_14_0_10_44_15 TaxID=1974569 RepID=A0A2H0UZE4_9BACT|nr:MAG: hypothetical protein COU01_03125 [Candidatus Falkowbacteria bacterium CG10_big_fil_rev_8_21_14_0_10_44_15]